MIMLVVVNMAVVVKAAHVCLLFAISSSILRLGNFHGISLDPPIAVVCF